MTENTFIDVWMSLYCWFIIDKSIYFIYDKILFQFNNFDK